MGRGRSEKLRRSLVESCPKKREFFLNRVSHVATKTDKVRYVFLVHIVNYSKANLKWMDSLFWNILYVLVRTVRQQPHHS